MKDNYLITIDNTQTGEQGKEQFSLSTVGEYFCDGARRTIRYRDSAATGFEGSETTLSVDPGRIVLSRRGANEADLVLEQGRRHICHYGTPEGDLSLGVYADRIVDGLGSSGGTLDFSYSLDINSGFFAANELKITVREKQKSNA